MTSFLRVQIVGPQQGPAEDAAPLRDGPRGWSVGDCDTTRNCKIVLSNDHMNRECLNAMFSSPIRIVFWFECVHVSLLFEG